MRLAHPRLHIGLKAKFVLTISFLILITSVILSVFLIQRQSSMIQTELEKRGELMVRNVAHNAEYGVLVENEPLLLNLMEGLYQEAEVVYIGILDRNGNVLAQWDRSAESHQVHSRTRSGDVQPPATLPSKKYLVCHGQEFYNFSCPIKTTRVERSKEEVGLLLEGESASITRKKQIGLAEIGMSLQNMRREIADMKRIVVLLTALVVAAGVGLTIFLVNIFIRPVKRLVQATERVAGGDLSHVVKVTTKDEIGTLASSFNRMTTSLKESREKIEEYNRTLEGKVKERTAELERTTKLLQVEYDRLEAIVNTPNLGIVIEDRDCNIRFMNKFLIEIFGNQVGEKCYRKFKGREDKCPVCPIDEILVKGKKTFTYLDQDTQGHHYELSSSLFQDERGESHILETLRDITEQKKLEQQVEEYTRNLEKTNRELENALRSLKETQAQLIQVEKMAAVGQLAAGVAHELNNPLGGILGYSQFALEKIGQGQLSEFSAEDTATFLQYLRDIEQQTKRCRSIIQSLLKFSRASRKEEFEPTDVSLVLDETLKFTRHQIQKSKVNLTQELAESLPLINGHSGQLQQVFTNLILNAVQAMPDGGSLTVASRMGEDEKTVQVSFTDTGVGISEKSLDKIFEPFFTSKKVGEGTGLGLSVSYGLITNHGGEIKVSSKVGGGTTFTVILPVRTGEVVSACHDQKKLTVGG
jgi:two-component system NtrC family sensor kinase